MDLIRNSARTRGQNKHNKGCACDISTTCSNTAACGWVNKYQKRRGGWRGGQADDPAWCANLVGVPDPLACAPYPRSTSTRSMSILSPFHWLAAEGKERMGFSILCMSPFASLSLCLSYVRRLRRKYWFPVTGPPFPLPSASAGQLLHIFADK